MYWLPSKFHHFIKSFVSYVQSSFNGTIKWLYDLAGTKKKKEFNTDTLKQEQHFISNQEFIL